MIKKLLAFVIVLATFASGTFAYAQTSQNVVPNIYVRNVSTSGTTTTFSAGSTIKVDFDFVNGDPVGVSDVIYQISLATGYESNGLVGSLYGTTQSDPVFVGPNATQHVQASYTLPTVFDTKGKLALHVQAFLKSGIPLGWTDLPISVTGGTPALSVDSASLTINNVQYNISVGPTISNNQTGTLNLTISNPGTASTTVTPHVKIYDHSTSGAVLQDYTEVPLTFKSKGMAKISYALPTFNYTPGVYLGEINFIDPNNIVRSEPFQFRYIIAGNIATIHSVTTTQTQVAKGDSLPITINYSGTPLDISNNGVLAPDSAFLDVKVFNEKDQMVGEYQDTTNFNSGTSKTVTIQAAYPAVALRVIVTATTSEGKTLAAYSTNITANYDQAHTNAVTTGDNHLQQIIYGIIALVIALVIVILVLKLFNPKHSATLVIIFAIACSGAYVGLKTVHAYTETGRNSINAVWDYTGYDFANGSYPTHLDSKGNKPQGYQNPNGDGSRWHVVWCTGDTQSTCDNLSPQVTINSPGVTDNFIPGQQFYLTGSAYALACSNNPQDIVVTASMNGQNPKAFEADGTNGTINSATHDKVTGGAAFSVGPFTAPTTPGTYTLTFQVNNYTNIPGRTVNNSDYQKATNPATGQPYGSGSNLSPATSGGDVEGSLTIVVKSTQAPVVTLVANPNPIDYGATSQLSWSVNTQGDPATTCTTSDGTSSWTSTTVDPATTGPYTTDPLFVSTKYTLSCKNSGGSATASAIVSVNPQTSPSPSPSVSPSPTPAPVVSIYANPNPINPGGYPSITWYSNNADSCTSPDFNTNGLTNYSGTDVKTNNPITSPTTISITCTNSVPQTSTVDLIIGVTQNVTATCYPTLDGHNIVSSTIVGTPVTWIAQVSGGTVTWHGDGGLEGQTGLTAQPSTTNHSYSQVGLYQTSITVSSPNGDGTFSDQNFTCQNAPFKVKPSPTFQEI